MNEPIENETRSPWYECFEPQTQADAAVWPLADADEPTDDDGACEALFDYYNA